MRICCSRTTYTGRIEAEIDEAKAHQKWRTEYMVWEAKIWDERKEAREEGRTEGVEYSARRMLESGMSAEEVARILEIDADRVRELSLSDDDN